MGAFCRMAGAGSACPCALSALEEHNFLFQLQAPERPPEDAKEVRERWGGTLRAGGTLGLTAPRPGMSGHWRTSWAGTLLAGRCLGQDQGPPSRSVA